MCIIQHDLSYYKSNTKKINNEQETFIDILMAQVLLKKLETITEISGCSKAKTVQLTHSIFYTREILKRYAFKNRFVIFRTSKILSIRGYLELSFAKHC